MSDETGMTREVKVSGASDDLIEIEGALNEEFSAYGADETFVGFSDGTVLRVAYGENGDGFWRVSRVVEGTAEYSHRAATDEEKDYSDVVTLSGVEFTRVTHAETLGAANLGKLMADPRYAAVHAFAAWLNAEGDDDTDHVALADTFLDEVAS